ncbi:MAG: DUF2232 domain-containing protein [Alphaproteobacteria bacterium]|nr:DUF2232 domain-containing protein [Alphaproteobacteria bacterium]
MGRLGTLSAGAFLGALGAVCYLAVLTGSPGGLILAFFAQLPLFAAGLWLGVGSALTAGITASVVVLAEGGPSAGAAFAAVNAAPVVLLTRQALLARSGPDGGLEWYPAGLLVAWLSGLGLAGLAAAVAFLGGPSGIETYLNNLLAPLFDRLASDSEANRAALVRALALVTPGTVAASWMTMSASNAILAQGVLARLGKAWRPSPDLAGLTLPIWPSMLLAAAAVLAVLGGTACFLGVNLLIVLSVPFCLAGLAVLHTAVRRLPRPQFPLVAFYVLAGLFGWPLVVIAVIGALDAPLGLRRRFAPIEIDRRKIE